MKYYNGWSLIEICIGIFILGIVIIIILGVISGGSTSGKVTWGINGMTEERCIGGYKMVIGQSGSAQQILDNNGKGIKCE